MQHWSKVVFRDLNRKKRRVLARLNGVQLHIGFRCQNRLLRLECKLRKEFVSLLQQEELLWFQKTRCDWIVSWEKNTGYFHRLR